MRHDHTEWVIHFVRDRMPSQDFPGHTEEERLFYAGGELAPDASAFEVLCCIIRLGGITPGYSFRKGKTTIYGGKPAICATEMPLYSFADYVKSRAKSETVSAYGIAFLKSEFHLAGGRHAIYALSQDGFTMVENDQTRRILPSDVLPRAEQYRYVAYNPNSSSLWIDWSHEREWRWVQKDEERDVIWVSGPHGTGDTPALPLFKGKLDGRPFTKVCIIVWTREEADKIQKMLTGFYFAGGNNYDTSFDRDLIKNSKIIILADVVAAVETGKQLESQTIEGLEDAQLIESIKILPPPKNAAEHARKAISKAHKAADTAHKIFVKKHGNGDVFEWVSHVSTEDVTDAMVQYMLSHKLATGPYDGVVWIDLPASYNEAGCRAAAKSLEEYLNIEVFWKPR